MSALISDSGASLYRGVVTHRRFKPVEHRFAYRVFSMLIDLDRIEELDRSLRLFSRNRFNLFSLHERDHGDGSGPLCARIRALLRECGFSGDGRIALLCYPRILGYAFNPLSIFYCHDADGGIEAVLYEVRNTFGGKHSYLIPAEDGDIIRQQADKRFHVSPFIGMTATYEFLITPPGDSVSVVIHERDAEGPLLNATFTGQAEPMTDRALFAAFLRYPLMTLKVIAAIHFEALRLLAKGLKLRAGLTPQAPVTFIPRIDEARTVEVLAPR
jgi:DUF1365 family protein